MGSMEVHISSRNLGVEPRGDSDRFATAAAGEVRAGARQQAADGCDGMAVRPSHPQRRHQRTVTPRPRLSSPPGGAVLVGSGRASPPLSWDNSSVPATCLVGRVSGSPLGRVEGIPRGQQKDQSAAHYLFELSLPMGIGCLAD